MTYRNFFVRETDNDEAIDSLMINEIRNAYESLSNRLKKDVDILQRALKSYQEISEFAKDDANLVAYFEDGVYIKLDAPYMRELIDDVCYYFEELLNKYEEVEE